MKSIEWLGDQVRLIDQTKLPLEETYLETDDYTILADAIRTMKIRGAPAIGIAAAYGIALAALKFFGSDFQLFRSHVEHAINELSSTRPTAVNLFWSLQRMKNVLDTVNSVETARKKLISEALNIHREDEEMCRKIGEHGATLIEHNSTLLTHCNTGALATGGEGTAQSIITTAHRQGKSIKVYATETRPALQGARLTTWELLKNGIDVTLITDTMTAFLMKQRKIDLVVVGADRIASNGDVANKIGTYNLAVIAKHHGVPFYVAAPSSTIDSTTASGDSIPIEERSPDELMEGFGRRIAPEGIKVYSPAFDITPASFVTAIITEQGVHKPPFNFS
ncbi:MAG: S-methyl-5-thioribose-1-phosphate isomerase [Ignavibacteriae bacterium]|nr:S-methyl-5-thioribose-1-phosphate isomerase [Ignavibacteriota bacterium]